MQNKCQFKPYGQEEQICKTCGYIIWNTDGNTSEDVLNKMIEIGYELPACKTPNLKRNPKEELEFRESNVLNQSKKPKSYQYRWKIIQHKEKWKLKNKN